MDHQQWFEQFRTTEQYRFFQERPIVYFCAEFALAELESNYAGGLGVLAGDVIKEAADQKLPIIGVGMFYDEGYLHHELQFEGTVLKRPVRRSPEDYGFSEVKDKNNSPLHITVPLEGRKMFVRAWEKRFGSVRLFLLDTDISENDQADRNINNRLYIGNKETRFKQQIVLGIAGLRLLEELKIHPSIYHLNEGHSALLSFELAFHEMKEYNSSFLEELKRAKQHLVFTNHTLLPAGNDVFNNDMVSVLLTDYSSQLQVPVNELVSLGLVKDSSIFSMSLLALRMASHINAVSKLHAQKAKDIWSDHPMIAVTNGVHVGTWDKIQEYPISNVKFQMSKEQSMITEKILPKMLWTKHQENKRELLQYIEDKTGNHWDETHLLLGWARRMVNYKRPLALFKNQDYLHRLVSDARRPIRIVMAGSAHESDLEGAKMLDEIRQLVNSEMGQYITYLPEYNIKLAQLLIPGCDVWLNTPIVGFEACGTSGMKACLNGVLPCTTKDGWLAEVELYKIGWSLDSDKITESLLTTIDHNIVPHYYYRDKNDYPAAWVDNMKNARDLILNNYSAGRMLREYIASMYLPVLDELRANHQVK